MLGLWVLHEADLFTRFWMLTVCTMAQALHMAQYTLGGLSWAVLKTLSSGWRPLHLWACLSKHGLCGVCGSLTEMGVSEEPCSCCTRNVGKKIPPEDAPKTLFHNTWRNLYTETSSSETTLVGVILILNERITQFGSRREGWKTLWLIERFYMYSNLGRTESLDRRSGQLQWWMDGSVCFGLFDLSSCF